MRPSRRLLPHRSVNMCWTPLLLQMRESFPQTMYPASSKRVDSILNRMKTQFPIFVPCYRLEMGVFLGMVVHREQSRSSYYDRYSRRYHTFRILIRSSFVNEGKTALPLEVLNFKSDWPIIIDCSALDKSSKRDVKIEIVSSLSSWRHIVSSSYSIRMWDLLLPDLNLLSSSVGPYNE